MTSIILILFGFLAPGECFIVDQTDDGLALVSTLDGAIHERRTDAPEGSLVCGTTVIRRARRPLSLPTLPAGEIDLAAIAR